MYRWMVGHAIRYVYRSALSGQDRVLMLAAAEDVRFRFPGASSFGADLVGREALRNWLVRFRDLNPRFEIPDVVVSGPPWNMTVAARIADAIGSDYQNEGVEWLRIKWGKVRSIEVFIDTERLSAWEVRNQGVSMPPAMTS